MKTLDFILRPVFFVILTTIFFALSKNAGYIDISWACVFIIPLAILLGLMLLTMLAAVIMAILE